METIIVSSVVWLKQVRNLYSNAFKPAFWNIPSAVLLNIHRSIISSQLLWLKLSLLELLASFLSLIEYISRKCYSLCVSSHHSMNPYIFGCDWSYADWDIEDQNTPHLFFHKHSQGWNYRCISYIFPKANILFLFQGVFYILFWIFLMKAYDYVHFIAKEEA